VKKELPVNKLAIALVLGAIFAVGCGDKKEEGKSDTGSSGDKIGVAECDEYLTKMEACLGKMPAEAKAASEQGFKANRDAWKQAASAGGAAKDALKTGCKTALDAMAANPMCK
jgi:phage tail sheath protein FI